MPKQDRTCKNIHDFSLLLTEMSFLNSQDKDWEEKPRPRYFLADTGVFGSAGTDDIWIFFPESKFPLSEYGDRNLENNLRVNMFYLNIDVENLPKAVTGYRKYPRFNYVLRKQGVKDSYNKNVGKIYNWLGFIRPTEDGKQVHAMIDKKCTNKENIEHLLEAIIKPCLGIAAK